MEIFIMIIFFSIGIIIAIITWKLYPYFLSRRDKYRNSPFEIQKQRSVTAISAFLVTCFCGYLVIKTMRDQNSIDKKKNNIEIMSSSETSAKEDLNKKTTESSSANEIKSDKINSKASQKINVNPVSTIPTNIPENSALIKGYYPQASESILTASELSGMSKQDLLIMRNEIFARHGYIFKKKEIQSYFTSQPWYRGQYEDVTSMLSDIEKMNIELIKKHE